MISTEVVLRLIAVMDLYGDRMLKLINTLTPVPASEIDYSLLQRVGLSAKQAQRFLAVTEREIEHSLHWLEHPEHHLLLADDESYPGALQAIADYPAALLVEGRLEPLCSVQLAVVGSRVPSWYGERWGRYFCESLACRGLTITSGLALGIDGVAHRAALSGEGKTIAVLGSGLTSIYPRRHVSLARQIVAKGGALVSEFPLSEPPLARHFPRRNRIISGLSQGVLVIEAALKSGSLVTARCAADQGREVFAIPGPLGNPGAEGPHWLIRQGLRL